MCVCHGKHFCGSLDETLEDFFQHVQLPLSLEHRISACIGVTIATGVVEVIMNNEMYQLRHTIRRHSLPFDSYIQRGEKEITEQIF